MKENIIKNLTPKDDKFACAFADKVILESKETDEWYEYFDDFASLLDHPKSLVRNRVMKEVMRFAENALGMEECVTAYAKVNLSSANVLHKLGFTDKAEIPYECSGGDMITEGILCRYKKI